MKSLLLLPFLFLTAAHAQVINIESYRIRTDTAGWAGSGDLSAYIAKYDETVVSILTNVQLQYKFRRNLFLMLTDIATVQADESRFVNSGFQHFRYNYKFTDRFVGELFLQGQYNEPLAIEWRLLAGAGPRYKISGSDKFRLYIAALYMLEREKDTGIEDPYTTSRLSSYVSFTLETNENYTLTSTTYFQPNLSDFNDFRLSTAADLKTYLSKYVYVKLKYSLLDDKLPTLGNPTIPHFKPIYLFFERQR